MKAKFTFSYLFCHESLKDLLFRSQATKTAEELIAASNSCYDDILNAIDESTEDFDVDDVEELFYSSSVSEIIEELDLTSYGIDFPYLEGEE